MSAWWVLWFALLNGIPYVGGLATIAQLIIVGFLDGTPGPNRFGPDPKGRDCFKIAQRGCSQPKAGIINENATVNTPVPSSALDRIAKLDKLKDKGLIKEDEYAKKRAQILAEL